MASAIEFKYINVELYRHPGEREARARMEKIPGFAKALAMLTDNSGNKAERQAEIASMARVGPGVYPVLNDMWNDVQNLFGLSGVPVHIGWNCPQPWSLRGGNDSPGIVLDSGLLESLSENEMLALLGTQAGSIRLGNATLLAAADFMRWFIDYYGIAGAPAMLPAWGIENWRRQALFSADRAAALSQGDPEGVSALLCRLAGAGGKVWGGISKADDLRVQGLEALSHQSDWSNSRMRRFALAMNRQNNVALIRRIDLLDWFSGGAPARILSGEMTEPEGAKRDMGADASSGVVDPSLAYWGEFAGSGQEKEGADSSNRINEFKEMAEKGLSTFMKAGEAFWNTLMENNKK